MDPAPTGLVARPSLPGTRERAASPWLDEPDHAQQAAPAERPEAVDPMARWALAAGATVAPLTLWRAGFDWWLHLAASPAKQMELTGFIADQMLRPWLPSIAGAATPQLPQDKRFADPAWQRLPHALWADAFLRVQAWWQRATTGVPAVDPHHEQIVAFAARQWLDMVAPSNFVLANPVVQQRTLAEGGLNLLRGARIASEDFARNAADLPPVGAEAFRPGHEVAVTPGRVVLRNRLIELIQYAPTTRTVHPEPVVIVPAWIMKYYVLDLSPGNSLIRHLVDQGHTVFVISWKNPTGADRDLGMADYIDLGVRAALDAVTCIVPDAGVHAMGYCLGGTLLAIAAAALGRDGISALRTVTLLTAQTDFSAPGELGLFIDEDQVAFLEQLMAVRGYLDKRHMQSTFQMLRSADLIWSYRLQSQLLGERRPVNDLMAWNLDGTRLPARMHSEYLRGMFLDNALARGEWRVDRRPVNLGDIRVPIFSVGTVQDHVAPWRSVYKLHALTRAEQTFVLTAGGHNVGIVNPPGAPRASYRMRSWHPGDRLLTPDEWLEATPSVAGSWWQPWCAWLRQHSGRRVAPPSMGAGAAGLPPLEAAPGLYVHER